jgi:S-adenosylmethionine decarboxylase
VAGPEKLLEVWFAPSATSLPATARQGGLKSVGADKWVEMLDMVNCKILSVLKSEPVDAYLLSESSMFVFEHKIILKTCGTTTLLLGLRRLLRIAAVEAGFPFHNCKALSDISAAATPYRVFYSRKNFLFPDKQQGPHRSWKQEVKYLDDMFEGGSAYMVGKMNGDHWYLYITSPNNTLTPPRTPEKENAEQAASISKIPARNVESFNGSSEEHHDETLEILMTDLDTEHAKQFYLSHASAVAGDSTGYRANGDNLELDSSAAPTCLLNETVDVFGNCHDLVPANTSPAVEETMTTEGHMLGTVVSDGCGLSDVYPKSKYPEARIDAYLFSPCGFSANGVIPAPIQQAGDGNGKSNNNAAHYFTVHVTPEPNCSFASFETNVPGGQNGRTTADIIEHVVDIFRPGRFSVTLFEAKGKSASTYGMTDDDQTTLASKATKLIDPVRGYRRIDRIVHDFEDYDLVFRFYERDGWSGSREARVGEVM